MFPRFRKYLRRLPGYGPAQDGRSSRRVIEELECRLLLSDVGDTSSSSTVTGIHRSGDSFQVNETLGNGASGDRDVDLYQFIANGADVLQAQVSAHNAAGDVLIRLFDQNGQQLAASKTLGGFASLVYTFSSFVGYYYIGVSGDPNDSYSAIISDIGTVPGALGDYGLSISLSHNEPGDDTALAQDLQIGNSPVHMTLSEYIGDGTWGDMDVDLFKFQSMAGTHLYISAGGSKSTCGVGYLSTCDTRPIVRVFYQNPFGLGEIRNDVQFSTLDLPFDGTYFIGFSGNPNSNYNAALQNSGVPTDDRFPYRATIDIEPDLPDSIGPQVPSVQFDALKNNLNDRPFPDRDVDFVRIDVPPLQTLSVKNGYQARLRLFDSAQQQVATGVDDLSYTAGPTGGRYFLGISADGNDNYNPAIPGSGTPTVGINYQLAVSFSTNDPGGTIASATQTSMGPGEGSFSATSSIGSLVFDSTVNNYVPIGLDDVDVYSFYALAGSNFQARTDHVIGSSDDADTVLQIFDKDGKILETDDNGGGGGFSFVHHIFTLSGKYYIGVSGYNNVHYLDAPPYYLPDDAGDYSLSMSQTEPPDVFDSIPNATPTGLGPNSGQFQTHEFIGNGPGQLQDIDMYRFDAAAGIKLVADTSLPPGVPFELDTYLRLFDAAGNELAANDNVSASLDFSHIAFTLPVAGTYYIGVSSAKNHAYGPNDLTNRIDGDPESGGFGDYILTLSLEGNQGVISGVKWNDRNNNGSREAGEEALAGWTIFIDANGNGFLDAGETSTVTDANGAYSFPGLSAGDYHVAEVLKPGWSQTSPAASPIYLIVRNIDPVTGATAFGGHIAVYGTTGQLLKTITSPQFATGVISDVEVGPDGKIYVSQDTSSSLGNPDGKGRLVVFKADGSFSSVINIPDDLSGPLLSPFGFDIAADGSIYVAQPGAHQILHGTPDGQSWTATPDGGTPVDVAASAGGIVVSNGGAGNRGINFLKNGNYLVATPTSSQLINGTNGSVIQSIPGDSPVDVQQADDGSVFILLSGASLLEHRDSAGNLLWSVPISGFPAGLAVPESELSSALGGIVLGFESGGFDGWSTLGNTSVVSTIAVQPPQVPGGTYEALLKTDNGVDAAALEGLVQQPLAGSMIASAIQTTVVVPAATQFTFNWRALTDDPNAGTITVARIIVLKDNQGIFNLGPNLFFRPPGGPPATSLVPADPATGYAYETPLFSSGQSFGAGGTFTLTFEILSYPDTLGNYPRSALLIDNLRIFNPFGGAPGHVAGPAGGQLVHINPGQVASGIDFGNHLYQPATLNGVADNDLDGDNQFTVADNLLAGRTIYLDLNHNGALDANEPTQVTDSAGGYTFAKLPPGTYDVQQIVPVGWQSTVPLNGPLTVTLGLNEVVSQIDLASRFQHAVLAGTWQDVNLDGIYDPSEPRLPGVNLCLMNPVDGIVGNANDIQISCTISNGGGLASFEPATPGHYYLKFDQPFNEYFTISGQGDADHVGSDPEQGTGLTTIFDSADLTNPPVLVAGFHIDQTIFGTPGDDTFYLTVDPSYAFFDVYLTDQGSGPPNYALAFDAFPSLEIFAGDGDDRLILELNNGTPFPLGGLSFDGGNQAHADIIEIRGTNSMTGEYDPNQTIAGAGIVDLGTQTLSFSDIEPLLVRNFGSFTMVTPNSADDIHISAPQSGQGHIGGTSGGVAFEFLDFVNVPNVKLDLTKHQSGNAPDLVTIDASGPGAAALQYIANYSRRH